MRFVGARAEPNRFVDLGGGAQLSVGSPDGHRIVVQWRDPGGDGWTAPTTVWREADRAFENVVRHAGGTVVVHQSFLTPDAPSDGEPDGAGTRVVAIVCRDLACEARRAGRGTGGEPEVTPDGRTVLLGQDEAGVSLWTDDRSFVHVPWSGHPGFDHPRVSPSSPALAPDGSLRVVTSRPDPRRCDLRLLTSEPRSAALRPAAEVQVRLRPLRGAREVMASDCATYLLVRDDDRVEVHPSDLQAPVLWFERDRSGAWAATRERPRP